MYNITDRQIKEKVYEAFTAQDREFRQRLSFGVWQITNGARNFVVSTDSNGSEMIQEAGIIKLDISQQGNSNGSGLVMGCCCSSSCSTEFYNSDKSFNYNGKVMFAECGVKLDGDDFFYIPVGYYTIDKPETDDGWRSVSFTAYDDVARMTAKWNSKLAYPNTAKAVLEEITGRYGIEVIYASGLEAILKSRTITSAEAASLTAYSEREVCGFISGLVGANARMNTAGKMKIGWYSVSSSSYAVEITADIQWKNGFKKTSNELFEICSVTSGIDDKVFTSGTGKGISFVNPIITQSEILSIYILNKGKFFQPCSCEWRGNPCVECGDTVVITDKDGNKHTVCVADQEIDLTGGLSMVTHCPGGDAEISFDTVNEQIRTALNRQKNSLQQAIVEATNAINGQKGGFLEIKDTDGDGNPDEQLIKQNEDGSGGIIRANASGIGLSEDGGKTYRTAITYKGINAEEINVGIINVDRIPNITADKLSVGEGEFVNILSTNNPDSLEAGNGLLGYNLDIQKESNYLLAKPKIYSNLFGEVDGEFISTKIVGGSSSSTESTGINGWVASNSTYSNYFANQGLYFLMLFPKTSSTTTTNSSVYHTAYLKKGAKYSLSAQINCNNWSAQNSTTNAFWYRVGDSIYTFDSVAKNQRVSNKEMTIEFVFEYKGETGEQKVGLAFAGLATTRINIAWVNLNEVLDASSRANGFYCTERTLITEDKYLLNSGTLINSAVDFQKYISSFYTGGDTLFIALQKIALKTGKKYVLTARIRAESLSKTNEPKLMYWVGAGYTPIQQSFRETSGEDVVVQFVFRYTPQSEAETTDFGLAWKGLLKSDNTPVSMRIYWMTLWEDETSTEGFYSSYGGWLDAKYLTDYTLPDSLSAKIYAKTNALKVVDGYLMLYGNTQSNKGYVGCLDFSPKEVAVNGTSVFYQSFEETPLELSSCISSTAKLVKPNSLAGDFVDLANTGISVLEMSVGILGMAHAEFEASGKGVSDYKTYVAPSGIYVTDGSTFSCITPNKLYINGKEVNL